MPVRCRVVRTIDPTHKLVRCVACGTKHVMEVIPVPLGAVVAGGLFPAAEPVPIRLARTLVNPHEDAQTHKQQRTGASESASLIRRQLNTTTR